MEDLCKMVGFWLIFILFFIIRVEGVRVSIIGSERSSLSMREEGCVG